MRTRHREKRERESVEGESKHDQNSGGESYIELRHTRQEQCRTRPVAGVEHGLREGKAHVRHHDEYCSVAAYGIIVVSNCFV